MACQLCDDTCLTCSVNISNCLTCAMNDTQQLYLDGNNCIYPCLSNYLNSSGLFYCDQCDIACLECTSANSSTDCTTCNQAGGYNFQMGSTSSCIFGCPVGLTASGNPLTCSNCDANCLTCSSNITFCLTCPVLNTQQLYLDSTNNTCIYPCASNYLNFLGNFYCDQCHTACLHCTSVNTHTSCTSCN